MPTRSRLPARLSRLCALALVALGATGCQAPIRPIDGTVQLEIAAAPGGDGSTAAETRAVEMEPSNELVVRLGAHGGTGYVWEMAGPAPAALDALEPSVATDASGQVGATSWTTYRYRAIAQGEGVVRFVLRRPWEPAIERARQVDVQVTVKPAS